jgi:hypothetical protein
VDVEQNEIYIGATYSEGILKYVFDPNAANPVAGGPAGNYVFDSIVAPSCPGWPDTLAYDPNNDIWYAGNWDYEIYKYEGYQGPNGNWELAFTSFPYAPVGGRLQHHDGLAFVNGYLFLADMYGDWIMQYLPDGTLVNVYYHEPLGRDLEGMGWGTLGHFWSGSFNGLITEFGGGALQIGVGGVLPTTPPIYVEEGCILNGWEPNEPNNFLTWDVNSWDPNSHNIAEDPLFVAGYYLSQPVAGRQDPLSPCVDTGSADANDPNIGMDGYTTRVDGVNDVNIVDMGYHYSEGLTQYYLTVSVVDANGMVVDPNLGHGYVVPDSAVVYEGYGDNVVNLTAYADPNYRVKAWTGTDDDSSTDPNNTVTLTEDKHVTVEFELIPVYQLTVTVVGGHGSVDPNSGFYYDGTTVTLTATPDPNYRLKSWTGTNDDSSFALTNTVTMNSDKIVVVEFEPPRKIAVSGGPDAIANAINIAKPGDTLIVAAGTYNGSIDFQGKDLRLFSTNPDDPNIVAQTIIDCQQSGRAFTFNNGEGPEAVIDGFTIINGSLSGQPGGAIYCGPGTSPTIVNLIISNCSVSFSAGGAIFIDSGSSPTLSNITINNCSVNLGVGGGICINSENSVTLSYCTINNCRALSGSGGAVYTVASSSPIFVGCNFSSNSATINGGGLYCGQGSMPVLRQCTLSNNTATYDGGAILCSSGCLSEVNECTITGNSAGEDGGGIAYAADNSITIVDCNISDSSAQYGGGLYFDSNCAGTIEESILLNNNADEDGGAIYLSDSVELTISDCDIAQNSAARGGGVYGIDCSESVIVGCNIANNEARRTVVWYEFYNRDPNDPNLPIGPPDPFGSLGDPNYIAVPYTEDTGIAQGGGIYSFAGPSLIADCQITLNRASTSGGGMYLAGDFSLVLRNCLININRAGRDGGGISANWQVEPVISNCTIADNEVIGTFGLGYGGGLYCSYESKVEVSDSIIWGNISNYEGSQIAVASGDLPYPLPSTVNITYSDIEPEPEEPNAVAPTALDLVFVIDTTGSMSGEIDAVKVAATDIVNTISAQIRDYRIGVVTYEDYGTDFNYPSDLPYEDILAFSSDLTTIVNGIDTITLGGGWDGPETVYAGLMHAIDASEMERILTDAGESSLIEPNSPGIGDWRTATHVRRAIILIGDAQPKDPEPHSGLTLDDIIAAATMGVAPIKIFPIVTGYGVGNPTLESYFGGLADGTGGVLLEASDPSLVVEGIMTAISMIRGMSGPPIYVEELCTLQWWNADSNSWDPNSHNIGEDPNFVTGYYLSQPVIRRQDPLSPCVDTGSGDANDPNIGMDKYTTRIDGVNDVNVVDMGYHYSEGRPRYTLTVSVVDANGVVVDPNLAHGYVDPVSTIIYEGDPNNVVTITAYPDPNYQAKKWTGTDDDTISSNISTVTLDKDKHVTVEFEVIPWYHLTVTVVGSHGSVDPNEGMYPDRSVVTLTAKPDPNYRVQKWTGTDDDSSWSTINTVTIHSDANVTVEFGKPVKIYVSGGGNALRQAINSARSRDTVLVDTGTYTGNIDLQNKDIRIINLNPDDRKNNYRL